MTITAAAALQNQTYVDAHLHASNHRAEVEASERCGCFSCFRTFAPATIRKWIDKDQTALCPACGLDTVIGTASTHRIDDGFLRRLNLHLNAHRSR